MPVPIPGSELHNSTARSAYYHDHERISDRVEEQYDEEGLESVLPSRSYAKTRRGETKIDHADSEEKGEKPIRTSEDSEHDIPANSIPYASKSSTGARAWLAAGRPGSARSRLRKCMDVLIRNGVEERGIEPVPEEDRVRLLWWTVIPQWTLWSAANTNILTFSAGTLGPELFGLDLKSSVWTILVFGFLSTIPVAYFATFGPLLGMRQMVQARFSFGYFPVLLPAFCNSLTMLGFLAINAILGGQTLSLASGGSMSWDVGIVVVGIISLALSFLGLRALHFYSMALFPIILIMYFCAVGVTADKLHEAAVVSESIVVTSGQVLGYGATLIGFTIPYASLASDFTTYMPTRTPRFLLFLMVLLGLFIPIALIQIFGAACQLAAQGIPEWTAASEVGVANLLYAMFGAGKAARFVMVLLALSVTGNTAPTIYSCGLSTVVVLPFLVKVPRYVLAVGVTAIYVPIGIVGATHFYVALENFLAVLSYWTAIYIPPTIIEAILIRRPASLSTYPLAHWNSRKDLPVGYAAMLAIVCGIPPIVAGMSQTWWVGWIARKIPGTGDIGFEMGFVVTAVVYAIARPLERKYTGR